jgi:hypothetical protein
MMISVFLHGSAAQLCLLKRIAHRTEQEARFKCLKQQHLRHFVGQFEHSCACSIHVFLSSRRELSKAAFAEA